MSIRNFKNPWEADTGVLETNVLETDVLNVDVLDKSIPEALLPASTLSGVNKKSAKRLLSAIKDVFKGTEAEKIVKKWVIEPNGITLFPKDFYPASLLSIKDFDTRVMLNAFYHALTDGRVHIIEMLTREEVLSKYGKKQLELTNYKKQTFKYKTGTSVDDEDGGGKSITANFDEELGRLWINGGKEGAYCVIIMNTTSNVEQYSDGILRPSLVGEILVHELLGHGIGRYHDNYGGWAIDEAIQMGNLYLRIKNKNYYRTDHGVVHSENFNPHGIPTFYRFP